MPLLKCRSSNDPLRRAAQKDEPIRDRLVELAGERRRFGFRRLAILLRRDGLVINIKRVLRIYREAACRSASEFGDEFQWVAVLRP